MWLLPLYLQVNKKFDDDDDDDELMLLTGDRALASNYRLVPQTSIPWKLLKHIMCSNIRSHLDEQNYYRSEKQYRIYIL